MDPVKTERVCVSCDRVADTKEDVIPKWLQRHYELANQQLGLWNGTSIPYRQAVVPACEECNTKKFSRLEQKISQGRATDQEYYLWALKIRFGLAVRDTTLEFDRTQPGSGPLVSPQTANIGSPFIRHAFKAVEDPTFTFRPWPFGSVFRLPQGSAVKGEFGFVDVPPPHWALAGC